MKTAFNNNCSLKGVKSHPSSFESVGLASITDEQFLSADKHEIPGKGMCSCWLQYWDLSCKWIFLSRCN